jgi:hypothetical protein
MDEMQSSKCPKLHRARLLSTIPGPFPPFPMSSGSFPAVPDGSFKRYWLRVPPSVQTAPEAMAWTFDMPAEDYAPTIET